MGFIMLTNFARPECDFDHASHTTREMRQVFSFGDLLNQYDKIDALVEVNHLSCRFIVDRKPLRQVKTRLHNRYQVLNDKHELVAVCRTLAQAKSHL
jgi:hypothetical protein